MGHSLDGGNHCKLLMVFDYKPTMGLRLKVD